MKIRLGLRRRSGVLAWAVKRAQGSSDENGGAVVEFAVAIPLLMTVITGGASFSLALYNMQQLTTVTSSAVQTVAAEQTGITDPCSVAQTLIQGAGTSTNPGLLPSMAPANLNYQMTITDASGTAHQYPSSGYTSGSGTFSCTAGATEMAPNEPVSLTVKYSYTWVPIPGFASSLASPLYASATAMAD
jgi:Flp pilus assembly protein TadG